MQEARKYIQQLRKKQDNPYLWPDFLTGLPDKAAIIKRLSEVFPKLGKYSLAYVRISNVHPYLIKYGPDRHAEVIQWAAAILKTTSERCKNTFVGTLSTHDFIIICQSKEIVKHLRESGKLFRKKAESYYSKDDVKKGTALSFLRNDGEMVRKGLMKLSAVVVDRPTDIPMSHLIQEMGKRCEAIEESAENIVVMK